MLKAIIFDLDGTITELTLPLDMMRADTKQYYLDRGLPDDLIDHVDGISSTRKKAREYFLSQGMTDEEWTQMEKDVDALLSRHEGEAAREARLIEGVLEVVNEIRGMGLKTAILTNNGRKAMDIILQRLPLSDYFDVIQTRNESPSPKPYPDGILSVLEKLGVSPNEAIYVGDACIDAAAAKRAGIDFWAVTTGETSRNQLLEAGASKVFSSLSEILPLLRELHANE